MVFKNCIDKAAVGPINKANIKVAIPAVPPMLQPINTTVNSSPFLTYAMGKSVIRWRPVIRPSLGPEARFAIK